MVPEEAMSFDFSFRIPGWSKRFSVLVNGKTVDFEMQYGYCKITRKWEQGDQIQIEFRMTPEKVRSNPLVRENAGKIAIKRGPIIYCLEEADNGKLLANISIPRGAKLTVSDDGVQLDGLNIINIEAERIEALHWGGDLYSTDEPVRKRVSLKAVPYYYWGNRKKGEMAVWIRES